MTTIVVRRIYFYAAAFIGLQMLASGASELLGALLGRLLAPAALSAPELAAGQLSGSLALMLVGLPLWAIHWAIAQGMARRPEEQHARLRRVYAYLVLLVAALAWMFGLRDLLAALFGAANAEQPGAQAAAALGSLAPQSLIWWYHWRVFSADRAAVEPSEGTATLRRWYVVLVQAISLALAGFAAADLLHQLLGQLLAPSFGASSGIGDALAQLLAALAVWLPHQLWSLQVIAAPGPLRADERRSTLRQVYLALAITASAVAGLGSLASLLYGLLLATFGGAEWAALLSEQTWALATAIVAAPLWAYHRRLLADEARLSELAERSATARRTIGYLMAAIGLVALFFGLGELLSTLLRLLLAPDVIGVGWREPLSRALALALVAAPVYGVAAPAMERHARTSHAEERVLARRIYLYAALLFGIVATISAAVALLRLALDALLGAPAPDLAAELGRWAGYTLVGAAIATTYALLLRSGALRGDSGAGTTIAIIAEQPLRDALAAACAREAPGAIIEAAEPRELDQVRAALSAADLLILTLAAALSQPLAEPIRAYGGRRLLLASDAPGYELAGPRRTNAALTRAAAQALRAALSDPTPAQPSPAGAATRM